MFVEMMVLFMWKNVMISYGDERNNTLMMSISNMIMKMMIMIKTYSLNRPPCYNATTTKMCSSYHND